MAMAISSDLFLHEQGEVINVRVLNEESRMESFFFSDKQKLASFITEIDDDASIKAVFVQLQVIDSSTLHGLPHGKGIKRHHVGRYRWFVVDIDTLRPEKSTCNATDEEKRKSLDVAQALHDFLTQCGWPPAVFCDSGNGWHLVWRIDLEVSVENQRMLAACLKALAYTFNNDDGEIDVTLSEPEQLIKLWGTMVRKGENTELRPWRRSAVILEPVDKETVALELLQTLAAQAPVEKKSHQVGNFPEIHEDFDPEDFFEWCQENLPEEYQEFFFRDEEADHDECDGHHYVMDGCFTTRGPYRSSHFLS